MSSRLKHALLLIVVFVLLVLMEALGLPFVVAPGYFLVRLFTTLPDPYPLSDRTALHRGTITIVNAAFWASVVVAWFALLRARERRNA